MSDVTIKPNFLIAGCQKSGTTWLHSALSKSRHIFGSDPKELMFFSKMDYEDHKADYIEKFRNGASFPIRMESTPHYFQPPRGRIDIAQRIKDFLDDPRIMVVFRNPIERYESAYIHHMMRDRLEQTSTINDFSDEFKMLSLGKYAEALEHWRTIFPNLKTVFYDEIKEDSYGIICEVMEWLSLDNDLTVSDIDFRTNDKVLKAQRLNKDHFVMPKLSDDLRMQLRDFYEEDVKKLGIMTDRDLSAWLT